MLITSIKSIFNRHICILIILAISNTGIGQTNGLGSWNIANVKYNHSPHWSFFGEAQIRSLAWYQQYNYYEIKGGVNYALQPSVLLTLGMGSYQTYQNDGNFKSPKINDEFRIWPQLILSHSIERVSIEQRFRTEFRWTTAGFRNRYRYRLFFSYPIGEKKHGYQPWNISVGNEVFFGKNEPYFEQNRFQVYAYYRFSPATQLQFGYLNQLTYKINSSINSNYWVLGYYYELFGKRVMKKGTELLGKDQ